MTFFYDLNQKLAALAAKQDQQALAEFKTAESVARSPLAQALTESDYSAKRAAAGKDIGKPGKNFAKIAKGAAARYGSKAAGERVAGAVLNKLRHPKESVQEGTCPSCDCAPCKCESMDESALQAYLGDKKYGKQGMDALRKAGREHASKEKMAKIRVKYDKMDEGDMEEGNAFTGALAKTPKGGKFKVGSKEFTDTSSIEETGGTPMTPKQKSFAKLAPPTDKITFADKIAGAKKEVDEMLGDVAAEAMRKAVVGHASEQEMDEGFADMDAWLAQREKEKGTGKFDRKERTLPGGMKATTYTRRHDDEPEDDEEVTTTTIKKKGRPKGKDKDPERVTKGAWKHKGGRKEKTEEDIDTDGVMMTRPTNCSNESVENEGWRGGMHGERPLVKTNRKTGNTPQQQAYNEIIELLLSPAAEIDPYIRRHLMKLVRKLDVAQPVDEKAVSKAQQKFMGMVHATQKGEKAPSKEVAKVAKEMPKKAAKDFAATKHKGLPEKVKAKKEDSKLDSKEKKVEETTVAGSVATSTAAPKAGKGMQFGKGVYENLDRQYKQALTESISIQETVAECGMEGGIEGGAPGITIQASGEDAMKLMQLLKLAGLTGGDQMVDENSPDWPTNTEEIDADPELRTYSGGLNGPKSTGQTTTPVIASQLRRQASMEESVKLEKTLSDLYKNYKG